AKLALIQGEPQLYEAALADALDTARRWLRGPGQSFDEFAAALESLRATPIVVDIPPTGQSMVALRALTGTSAVPMPNEAPVTAREDQP
ncbi:MAG: uroporphyrinogen-III C-methyltransferase, partial [Burkholderiales bacterium]